jgi:hypothetical protein
MGFERPELMSTERHQTLNDLFRRSAELAADEESKCFQQVRADAKAVWALADYLMPADVKETAERWKMNETLQEIWRQAFIAGWRAAHKAKDQS